MTALQTTEKTDKAPAETKSRWRDSWDWMDDLQQEMSRLWGQRPLFMPRPMRPMARLAEGEWAPRLDVFEKNGNLVIKAELPGVKKEDIKVELSDNALVITGDRKAETEVKEADYYRIERAYGTFYRRLPLPFDVKSEQIQAKYDDGVLEVQIPRPAEAPASTKSIAVA